jgi:hypothetical protein
MPAYIRPVAAAVCSSEERTRFSPLRRPDWRYQQVLESLDRYPRLRRRRAEADHYLQPMQDYLFALRASRKSGQSLLSAQFPGPAIAWGLYRTGHPLTRLAIECRILARQSDADIARSQQLSLTGVEWYTQIFFDVRDRLDSRDWIAANVLHGAGLLSQSDPRATIQQLSYSGGLAVAEHLLAALPPLTENQTPHDDEAFFASLPVTDPLLRAAIAANAHAANKTTVLRLLKSARKISG